MMRPSRSRRPVNAGAGRTTNTRRCQNRTTAPAAATAATARSSPLITLAPAATRSAATASNQAIHRRPDTPRPTTMSARPPKTVMPVATGAAGAQSPQGTRANGQES